MWGQFRKLQPGSYRYRHAHLELQLDERGRFIIATLKTDGAHQGRGEASLLLARILELADRRGAALYLTPAPYGKGLDRDALVTFYQRRGFRLVGENFLQRLPRR